MGILSRALGKSLGRLVIDRGELPRWDSAAQGQWVLLGCDGEGLAMIIRASPDPEDPFGAHPDAVFQLVDASADEDVAETFDSLSEARARAEALLPEGVRPRSDPSV